MMDNLFLYGLAGLGTLLLYLGLRDNRLHQCREPWTAVARALGLSFEQDGSWMHHPPRIEGRLAGVDVLVVAVSGDAPHRLWRTVITVRPTPPLSHLFVLQAEEHWMLASVDKTLAGPGLHTGDGHFDSRVRIEGFELETIACLDHQTRRLLIELTAEGVHCDAQGLQQVSPRLRTDPWALESLIRLMSRAARALCLERASQIPERLRRMVQEDPAPGVRRRCLKLLELNYCHHLETRTAFQHALEDPDPEQCLYAASQAQPGSIATLQRLVAAKGIPAPRRVAALRRLAERGTREELAGPLDAALACPVAELQRAAIEIIARLRYRPGRESMLRLLDPADPETALAVVRALEKMADPADEPTLILLLGWDQRPVQIAAAAALSRMGTIRAVEPLLEHTGGLFGSSVLKEAAAAAIRSIQARLGDVEGGRLSLAETPDAQGALSLGTEPGALSLDLPEDPKDEEG